MISARNEAEGLRGLLPQLTKVCFAEGAEIVLVSDGSTDETAEVARSFHGIHVIEKNVNQGKLVSVMEGMRWGLSKPQATYRQVIIFDGDGQHHMCGIRDVLAQLAQGNNVVFASRYRKDCPVGSGQPPLDRQLLNSACRAIIQDVTGWSLTDPVCGLRGFTLEIAQWILSQTYVTDGYGFELETVLRLWHRSRETPLQWVEIPHPAIYNGRGKISEIYSSAHLEERLERIKAHQRHVVQVLLALGITELPNE
ncbi:MAG: glycosyltransferase family 2 protein [Patescibacteria group bacterium]